MQYVGGVALRFPPNEEFDFARNQYTRFSCLLYTPFVWGTRKSDGRSVVFNAEQSHILRRLTFETAANAIMNMTPEETVERADYLMNLNFV
jgi:hypothetical protein